MYLVYTAFGNTERLSVFDWNGTGLVNEQVLHTVGAASIHNGSRLLVLPDNTLLMSTGDTGDGGASSMNPNNDNGKILRFNLDGSTPADNPNPNSHVYSIGHRNSQGLCLGPNEIAYFSEHGQYNHDEFNILEADGNYGWPNVEGMCDGVCDWCNAQGEVSFAKTTTSLNPSNVGALRCCERHRVLRSSRHPRMARERSDGCAWWIQRPHWWALECLAHERRRPQLAQR